MKPIIFVHIPKTAGTSFRFAAKDYYGVEHCLWDYGLENESNKIAKLWNSNIISQEDYIKIIAETGTKFISGHFHASKYINFTPQKNFVSFVRNPIERVISEFNHVSTRSGYKESFDTFYKLECQKNRQSKLLSGIEIGSGAQIGITERFNESLRMINKAHCTEFRPLESNKAEKKQVDIHNLSEKIIEEINELNKLDIELYAKVSNALNYFINKGELYENPKPSIKGNIGGLKNKRVFGWALEDYGKTLVELEIFLNNEKVGSFFANGSRADIIDKTGKSCAFDYPLPSGLILKKGDEITIKKKGTDNHLNGSPFVVEESQ